MNILLLGATGFSGYEILKVLLKQNHNVTILVRDKTKLNIESDKLKIIEGNVLNETDLDKALSGQHVVIQALGIGGKGDGKPNSFVSDANRVIIKTKQKLGVQRYISMSNVGAGDSIHSQPWIFTTVILPLFLGWLKVIIDDKNIMEKDIISTDLDWTIVRCPNIISRPNKNDIKKSISGKGLSLSITTADMASFIVEQIGSSEYIKKAVSISN
jgi:putative NADH-flavin reductase